MEEPAPLIVKKDTIGLESILDPCAGFRILLLEFYGAPEKIKTHERWLTSLPRDNHLGNLVGFEKLPDIRFMHLIGHVERAFRIQLHLAQVEAVPAGEVTPGSDGFCHDMECRKLDGWHGREFQ